MAPKPQFPARGQKSPNFWDDDLKAYVDFGDSLEVVDGTTVLLDDTQPEGTTLGFLVKSTTTFDGEGGTSDLVAGVYTLIRTSTGWSIRSAGTGTVLGTPPDSTPPSAPSNLVLTGGQEQFTFSFTPGVDAESSPVHRFEYHEVGDAQAPYTNVSTNPQTVTGLAPGDYEFSLFAQSAGGNSSVLSGTFTVAPPSGYSLWDSHTFTAPDNTLVSTLATTEGRFLAGLTSATIVKGNAAAPSFWVTESGGSNETDTIFMTPPDGDRVKLEIEYDLTSYGYIGYTPFISIGGRLQTGGVGFAIGANTHTDATSANLFGFGSSNSGDLTPVYESGKTSNGHPIIGLLMIELDKIAEEMRAYVNGVLICTASTSGLLYGGNPNPLTTTRVDFAAFNRSRVRGFEIETYS